MHHGELMTVYSRHKLSQLVQKVYVTWMISMQLFVTYIIIICIENPHKCCNPLTSAVAGLPTISCYAYLLTKFTSNH